MYDVHLTRPGSQDYYDSIARLYACWGVDFIKADDMFGIGEGGAHGSEIEALAKAPRISDDFWESLRQARNWPDGDMLPLGHIGIRAEGGDPRMSPLTHDEQRTLMTLWSSWV